MEKKIQAKHIPDERLLNIIRGLNNSCWVTPMRKNAFWKVLFRDDVKEEPNRPAMVWDITALLPEFPPKVVMAKLASLLARGFLDGCSCGCRGDYKLTAKGRYRITPVTGDVP